jgi:hypothetical protein
VITNCCSLALQFAGISPSSEQTFYWDSHIGLNGTLRACAAQSGLPAFVASVLSRVANVTLLGSQDNLSDYIRHATSIKSLKLGIFYLCSKTLLKGCEKRYRKIKAQQRLVIGRRTLSLVEIDRLMLVDLKRRQSQELRNLFQCASRYRQFRFRV